MIAFIRADPSYVKSPAVFVARPDGSEERRLSERSDYVQGASWTPDGERVTYLGWEMLFSIRPDGTGRRALTRVDKYKAAIGWSPDGRYFALTFGRPNLHTWGPPLALVPKDGGDLRSLDILGRAAWSPDSKRLAYTETGSSFAFFPMRSGKRTAGLYALELETGEKTQLTHSGNARDEHPAWFPGGDRVAFLRHRPRPRSVASDLYVLEIGGDNLVRLAAGVREFAVSPDGSRLAWATKNRLFGALPDGSEPVVLARQPVSSLTWSSDSERIAYVAQDTTRRQGDIYTVSIHDGRVRRVTTSAADEMTVTWRP